MDAREDVAAQHSVRKAILALPGNQLAKNLIALRRVPFLRRSLAKSMNRIQKRNDKTTSNGSSEHTTYKTDYKVEYELGSRRIVGYEVKEWCCTLCVLINMFPFSSKANLEAHLSVSHAQCEYSWSESEGVS